MGLLEEITSGSFLNRPRRTWAGVCCVLGAPLVVWGIKKAFGVKEVEKAGQCHCETSLKHLGKARAARDVTGDLEKAEVKAVFKKGRKED